MAAARQKGTRDDSPAAAQADCDRGTGDRDLSFNHHEDGLVQPVCEARLLEEYAVLRALTLDDRPAIELHRVRSRGGHPAQPYSGACPIEQDIRVFERRDMRARLINVSAHKVCVFGSAHAVAEITVVRPCRL